MPGELMIDAIALELGAQEPWPQLIKLYQPYDVEHILLPDNANCLAVQAFLKMCNLDFQVEHRENAEYMSPNRSVPFIQCGAFLQSDFENIVSFIASKGVSLSDKLDQIVKSDMKAYISLVNYILVNAELYICWVDQTNLEAVTKPRHGSVYPWPLNHYLNWQKRNQVIKKLNVLGWYNKTLEEVFEQVTKCCISLSEKLDGKNYFFGNEPTEMDALVFGHIYVLTDSSFFPFNEKIATIINAYPSLIEHAQRINSAYDVERAVRSAVDDDYEIIENPSNASFWNSLDTIESLPSLSDISLTLI